MREYCLRCRYPRSTCVCDHISKLTSPVKLIILQHPDEVGQAKNTARLVALCCPQVQIFVGRNSDDFAQCRQITEKTEAGLIYPSAHSLPLEEHKESLPPKRAGALIFLDASWRKSRALWMANPWLHTLPQWHFARPPQSQYRIRHTRLKHSLSTIEAVAYTLAEGYQINSGPLLGALNALQSHWKGPKSHQR
ncbi:tRNA-uridine aminocarboxypropyltransferase [Alteromonas aestuariivivens]|uniref:tRNA-uridine aminocarboxypropyltransferase n=1 Tax=Alteromonas aestuariivivens TaxID=1938339 RepID=UPI0015F2963C|nr:tRNA-uridine aminocarboxypropyltransferase [Alteromonas aestuariivivens]